MTDTITINAFMDDDVAHILETLKKKGIDVTKCVICGKPIESWEVPPRYLVDKIKRWLGNPKKFYESNIDAIIHDGVVCDRSGCFVKALYRNYDEET